MKKIGLILVLLVAFSIISSAQVQDSVFLKSGKIIPCDINNIYDNYISYNYIHENGDTITEKRLTDQIAEIILRDGTSWNTYKQTKTKLYQSKVCTPDCSKGIIYETFDSEISFIDNYKIDDPYLFNIRTKISDGDIQPITIPVNTINSIKINRRFTTGKCIAIGSVTGLLTGILVGSLVGRDSGFSGPIILTGAMGGAICGAVVGGIIGSAVQVRIPINGNKQKYQEQRDLISKYSVTGR